MALTQQDIALIQQMGRQQNPNSIWDVLGNLAAQWIRKENGQSESPVSAPTETTPAPVPESLPTEGGAPSPAPTTGSAQGSTPIILNKTGTWFPMNPSAPTATAPQQAQFIPEYNRITPDDDLSVVRAKNRAQGYTFDTPSILDALISYTRR